MHDLGNSVFNVHQIPKVLIYVHQHQIPQVHAQHCQLLIYDIKLQYH
jgi:hypothetical protein